MDGDREGDLSVVGQDGLGEPAGDQVGIPDAAGGRQGPLGTNSRGCSYLGENNYLPVDEGDVLGPEQGGVQPDAGDVPELLGLPLQPEVPVPVTVDQGGRQVPVGLEH